MTAAMSERSTCSTITSMRNCWRSASARFCSRSNRRATRTRECPCAAYWRANSSPKPLDAPVMSTQDLSGAFISIISQEATPATNLSSGLFADSLHRLVQLLHESVPKNLLDLLLRLAPGRNCLFQKFASQRSQTKRLRAAVFVGHHFQPTTSLHSFDVEAEGRNIEMEMFANFNGASCFHLGGGDQDVHLAHLQVERAEGVVVEVGDHPIEHPHPHRDALGGDYVDRGSQLLSVHHSLPRMLLYIQQSGCQGGRRDFLVPNGRME